jgi:hypothetical protein
MDSDRVTLPNGDSIPASPENRDVARRLWAEDNLTTPAENPENLNARFKTETERDPETLKTEINDLRTENYTRTENLRTENLRTENLRTENLRTENLRTENLERRDRETAELRDRDQRTFEAERMQLKHDRELLDKDMYYMKMIQGLHQQPQDQPRQKAPHLFFDADPRDSRLSLRDPAVNTVFELLSIVNLPPNLINYKFDIQTICDLFDKTLAKSETLRAIVDKRPQDSSLRFALSKFVNAFGVKRGLDSSTKNILKLLTLHELCPATHPKLQLGVRTACELTHSERLELLISVNESGKLRAIENYNYSHSILDLPGIQELMILDTEEKEQRAIKSLCDLVVDFVCFEGAAKRKLTVAVVNWRAFSARSATDCETVIS